GYLTNESDSFQFITHDPLLSSSISSNTVYYFFQDRDGLIYIGSYGGVDRFNPSVKKFDLYRSFDLMYPQQWVRAFCEDNKRRLWVGTHDGTIVLDRLHNTVTKYRNIPNEAGSLIDNSVRSLCCDKNGTIWVGTAHGLARFNERTQTFKTYLPGNTNNVLPGDFIWNITCDEKNNLWIGTNNGLCYYDQYQNKFSNFSNDSSKKILTRSINALYKDANKNLWLGINSTGSPVACFNPVTSKIILWKYNSEDTASIGGNVVSCITQDKKGIMWFGTSGGLSRYNASQNNFTTFTTKNGLPNNHVAQLLFDDHNNLWMTTDNGLCMMNAEGTSFKKFDVGDGLQGKEFNWQSGYITYDGYFCFAGYDGFNMFIPDSLKLNTKPPPVIVRSVKIFDHYLNEDSTLFYHKPLHLSYNENFFTFEFAALNYDHPEKNQYACQLKGFDKKMISLDNSRTVSYTNVPPGNYTLRVLASNNDGVWNKTGIELGVIITPPFWRAWWFELTVCFVVSAILFSFYRYRKNQRMQLENFRTRISSDLHDDVGSTLTTIIMMSAMAEHSTSENSNDAKTWLMRIGNNAREMIDKMRDIVWIINPSKDALSEIIIHMRQYAAQLFEPLDIAFEFSVHENVYLLNPDFLNKRNIYLIFKEALNNAAKYAQCTKIFISLEAISAHFEMHITDNGKGFDLNSAAEGNGLRNMKQRAEQLGGKLVIETAPSKGTKIILRAPTRIRYFSLKRLT
ncbi:MAG TPA: two-component regulator propeller domain-containing protein, partial [Chitinophagaceae bacterium]